MYRALESFRKEHGDCNVCANWDKNPQLGRWVAMQRYRRKIGELPTRYVERLDKLGFVWSPTDVVWNEMYARLVTYRAKHGTSDVPSQLAEDPHLANWVANQRHRKKMGSLSPERAKRLDQAGFVWAVYGKEKSRKTVEKKTVKAAAPHADPEHEERLYMAGAGRYVQFNGVGSMPPSLSRYVTQHDGGFPPYIPLPRGPVVFHLGDDLMGRRQKITWSGKGPIPEVVREFVDENGTLPPHV
jgi:hypothetical protein